METEKKKKNTCHGRKKRNGVACVVVFLLLLLLLLPIPSCFNPRRFFTSARELKVRNLGQGPPLESGALLCGDYDSDEKCASH